MLYIPHFINIPIYIILSPQSIQKSYYFVRIATSLPVWSFLEQEYTALFIVITLPSSIFQSSGPTPCMLIYGKPQLWRVQTTNANLTCELWGSWEQLLST